MDTNVNKDYDLLDNTAVQYQADAGYLNEFARKSSSSSERLTESVETMSQAMDEIANATHEGAVGNTTVAEKVTNVADKAHDIMDKINASREGAENLKNQVARFKIQ